MMSLSRSAVLCQLGLESPADFDASWMALCRIPLLCLQITSISYLTDRQHIVTTADAEEGVGFRYSKHDIIT